MGNNTTHNYFRKQFSWRNLKNHKQNPETPKLRFYLGDNTVLELGLSLSFEGSHYAGMMATLQAACQAKQIGALARFMQLPSLALRQLWGKFLLSME